MSCWPALLSSPCSSCLFVCAHSVLRTEYGVHTHQIHTTYVLRASARPPAAGILQQESETATPPPIPALQPRRSAILGWVPHLKQRDTYGVRSTEHAVHIFPRRIARARARSLDFRGIVLATEYSIRALLQSTPQTSYRALRITHRHTKLPVYAYLGTSRWFARQTDSALLLCSVPDKKDSSTPSWQQEDVCRSQPSETQGTGLPWSFTLLQRHPSTERCTACSWLDPILLLAGGKTA